MGRLKPKTIVMVNMMKIVTAKELKNRTGEVIRTIKKGQEVLLSYHGRPLAKVVPLKKTSLLKEMTGIITTLPDDDLKLIRNRRLAERYEDIY